MIEQQNAGLMGLPLEEALVRLQKEGIEPEIIRVSGWREAVQGRERVIRVGEGGAKLTVARFPDRVK
jgi:hypothetical protein